LKVRACQLHATAPVDTYPLEAGELPPPEPGDDEVLVRVSVCGVCRTDLHVIEGDLPVHKSPLVPGHQVVGRIDRVGRLVTRFRGGERVGIPWLHRTCATCEYCRAGKENLCRYPTFTGYDVDGGYAEFAVAAESFVLPVPEVFDNVQAAPLLCAGIIGYRTLNLSGIRELGSRARIGFFGFGSSAHIAIQIAHYWGAEVFAFTRAEKHQALARKLGAVWAGGSDAKPPVELDAALIFAPAGELVITGLKRVKKGGRVVCAGIHMSAIPEFDYALLYDERSIRSVANNTREDAVEFLETAAAIPVKSQVEVFSLADTNRALSALKNGGIDGAAVIEVRRG
jgi:propanol-preferring alcohol dehydrogenase